MTTADNNLKLKIQPLVEKGLQAYMKLHPNLTEEQKATYRVLASSFILSDMLKQRTQLLTISKTQLN